MPSLREDPFLRKSPLIVTRYRMLISSLVRKKRTPNHAFIRKGKCMHSQDERNGKFLHLLKNYLLKKSSESYEKINLFRNSTYFNKRVDLKRGLMKELFMKIQTGTLVSGGNSHQVSPKAKAKTPFHQKIASSYNETEELSGRVMKCKKSKEIKEISAVFKQTIRPTPLKKRST